ncbi:MAG TPA: CBS domain-containing protein [Bryobacteraceae bacterium]|jgi:CBS domain-containing protein|nr:CBS domain-containing protein [Bryobacteraceae bacterium]
MQVRELMTSKPTCCTPDTPLQEVARMMLRCDCGEIPVVDSRESMRPIGAITDRDITIRALAEGRNPLELKASDCMTQPCVTVSENASIVDCIHLLEEHQIRRIPVVDARGRCCGIVSQADVARRIDHHAAEVLKQVSQPAEAHRHAR